MGYFDLKKQIQSSSKPKTGGYFELKESLADVIETNRAKEEYDRQQKERTEKLAEVRADYERNLAEAQKAISPWNVAKETVKETGRNILGFGKEVGKAVLRSGATVGDIASRLSPVEGIRNVASGVKTAIQRPQGETIPQAYERGVLESKARPTMYEKLEGKFQGKDYRLPELETKAGIPTGLITQPEYRKPLTSAMEAPTYLFGGKPVATAGKGLLERMLARTAATQPEAIIEAGLATAGEEKPTLKSAATNYLAATLLMSGISNVAGEIKIKRDSPKVKNTKKELEKIYGEELPDEANDDLAEAFSQGVEKKTILENAKKIAEEAVKKEAPKKEVLTPVKLKAGEFAPIAKEIQETTGKKLTATEQLKIKDDIEKGISKEKIIKDILEPPKRTELTSKAVKAPVKPQTTKKIKPVKDTPESKTDDLSKETAEQVASRMKKEGRTRDEFINSKQKIYHGTNKKFDTFDPTIGGEDGMPIGKLGTWFTDQKFNAENVVAKKTKDYNGKAIIKEAYVDFKNPKIYEEGAYGKQGFSQLIDDIEKNYGKMWKTWEEKGNYFEKPLNEPAKKFREKLVSEGYDGIIIKGGNSADGIADNQFIALKPEAVKTKQELIDIWNKSQPLQEGVKGKKKSELAKRINEDLPDDFQIDEMYDVKSIKNELNKASVDIKTNKAKAIREAFDKNTSGSQRVAKLTELAQIARNNKDYAAQNAILSRMRKEGTEAGQEINMFKAYNLMNPETEFMKHVVNARLKRFSVGIKDIAKAKQKAMEKLSEISNGIKKRINTFKVKDAQELFDKLICK